MIHNELIILKERITNVAADSERRLINIRLPFLAAELGVRRLFNQSYNMLMKKDVRNKKELLEWILQKVI